MTNEEVIALLIPGNSMLAEDYGMGNLLTGNYKVISFCG